MIESAFRFFRFLWPSSTVLLLAGAASAATAGPADSPEISGLLTQVRINVSVLSSDAATLESYTRSQTDWGAHARQLELVREHLDDVMGNISQLASLRPQGSEWQQETIDSIAPVMRSVAYDLISTMELMGRKHALLLSQQYRDYAVARQALVEKAVAVICSHIDYGEARARSIISERQLVTVTDTPSRPKKPSRRPGV